MGEEGGRRKGSIDGNSVLLCGVMRGGQRGAGRFQSVREELISKKIILFMLTEGEVDAKRCVLYGGKMMLRGRGKEGRV